MTLASFQSTAVNKFLSTPELWFNGVFHVLPFSSIETLLSVNKHLRSLSRKITHPTHLGIYPIGFWSNYILPLLDHKDLKKFQILSQVARRLTLSKKMSKHLFRSDVDIQALEKIPSTIKIQSGSRLKPQLPAINPFFRSLTYSIGMDYEEVYIYDKHTFATRLDPLTTHGIESYKTIKENATEPAVPILYVEDFDRDHCKVVGTGRPLFGGKKSSVTCEDVMKAFVKSCDRYSDYDGDHSHYEGFSVFERQNGIFVLGGVFWGS